MMVINVMKPINQNGNVVSVLKQIGIVAFLVIVVLLFVLMGAVHVTRKGVCAKVIVTVRVVFVLYKVVRRQGFVLVIQKGVNV